MNDSRASTHGKSSAQSMTPMDLAWLRMEHPHNRMIITGLLFFEQRLDLERLKGELDRRLLHIDRFRQRIRRMPGGRVVWEDAPDFVLDEHVLPLDLPAPGDQAALQHLVSEQMTEPLDEAKPLWMFYLVKDFAGGSVLITRLHHCIGDGIALMMLLLSLTDLAPDSQLLDADTAGNPLAALFQPEVPITDAILEGCRKVLPEGMKVMVRPSGGVTAGASRSRLLTKALAAITRLTFRLGDPKTCFKGELGTAKRAAWSQSIDLERIRELKEAMGATINDVLLTAMTGGLRRYLEGRGEAVDGINFRAAVPVSLRRVDKLADLGNQFGLVFLALPVGIQEPRSRLAELKRRMENLKGSFEAGAIYGVLYGMGALPNFVHQLVVKIFSTKATTVMTNVPGPRESLYFAGSRISDIMFWVPRSGKVSMGISIISYAGRVRLGVATDRGLVPDPETIIKGFHEELDEMRRLADLPL